jgi:hypothetical protein
LPLLLGVRVGVIMPSKFPNLPSNELAMLATVEAASNAGQFTVIPDPPRVKEHVIKLAALKSLVVKGWIKGFLDIDTGENIFYTDKAKVFKPTQLV